MSSPGVTTRFSFQGGRQLEIMSVAERYNARLLALVTAQARPGDRVLDFGAGAGRFALPLASQGFQVSCVEVDTDYAARLRQSGLFVHDSLEKVGAGSVDFAYSLNVLEHVADDTAALAGLYRALRPGGRLLLYVPAFPSLFSKMDEAVGHYRRYRMRGLSRRIAEQGFHVVSARYADALGFAASLAYKVFGSNSGEISAASLAFYDRFLFPVSCGCDSLTHRWFGKNLMLLAQKREGA